MAATFVNSTTNGASSGTNVTSSAPSSIQANDILVAIIHVNEAGAGITVTDNNGSNSFTKEFGDRPYNSDSGRYHIWYRVAGSSEPGTYSFTLSSSQRWSIIIMAVRGGNTSTIWNIAPSATTELEDTSGLTYTTTSITTTEDGCLLITFCCFDSATATFTSTPGDSFTNAENNSGEQLIAADYKAQASGGVQSAVDYVSDTFGAAILQMFAIAPSGAAATSVGSLVPTADSTIGADTVHDAGTTPPFYSHADEGVPSAQSDWVGNNQAENSTTARFEITDVPSDFQTMSVLGINATRQAVGFANDTCSLTAQIFASGSATSFTNSVEIGNQTNTSKGELGWTSLPLTATGSAADKDSWNAAQLLLTWTYAQNTGPDNAQLEMFAVQITGAYIGLSGNTYNDDISLSHSLVLSDSANYTFETALLLGNNRSISDAPNLDAVSELSLSLLKAISSTAEFSLFSDLSLDALKALSLSAGQDFSISLSLSYVLSVLASSNFSFDASLSLSQLKAISYLADYSIGGAVSLNNIKALALTNTVDFDVGVSLGKSASMTDGSIITLAIILDSLQKQLDISTVGGIDVNDAISLAHSLSINTTSAFSFFDAINLSRLSGAAFSIDLALASAISLAQFYGISASTLADFLKSLSLDSIKGITALSNINIDTSTTFTKIISISLAGVTAGNTYDDAMTLQKSLAVSILPGLVYSSALSLAQQNGISLDASKVAVTLLTLNKSGGASFSTDLQAQASLPLSMQVGIGVDALANFLTQIDLSKVEQIALIGGQEFNDAIVLNQLLALSTSSGVTSPVVVAVSPGSIIIIDTNAFYAVTSDKLSSSQTNTDSGNYIIAQDS